MAEIYGFDEDIQPRLDETLGKMYYMCDGDNDLLRKKESRSLSRVGNRLMSIAR